MRLKNSPRLPSSANRLQRFLGVARNWRGKLRPVCSTTNEAAVQLAPSSQPEVGLMSSADSSTCSAAEGSGSGSPGTAQAKPPWRRIALFGVLVAALLALVYLTPLKGYLMRNELSQALRNLGWMGPVVLMLSVALLVALGFPRLLF